MAAIMLFTSIRNMEDEGGMQMPRPAFPVFMVAAPPLDQPDSRIQGMGMEPTVAALALLAQEPMPNSALAQADT